MIGMRSVCWSVSRWSPCACGGSKEWVAERCRCIWRQKLWSDSEVIHSNRMLIVLFDSVTDRRLRFTIRQPNWLGEFKRSPNESHGHWNRRTVTFWPVNWIHPNRCKFIARLQSFEFITFKVLLYKVESKDWIQRNEFKRFPPNRFVVLQV